MTYFKHHNVDDLLFFLHCSLFGAAAIMFKQAELWNLPWWGWHLLRLMAYGVALWFIVLTQSREQRKLIRLSGDLKQLNETLEKRVEQMTHELREKNANLEESNLELQQFAYIASHDLQSPLRNIYSFAQLLQNDYKGKLDEQADDRLDRIGNGIKRHSDRPPCVHLSAETNGGESIFSVRDNGIGIDPEHHERIFGIFRRLDTQRQYPGAGIGLVS